MKSHRRHAALLGLAVAAAVAIADPLGLLGPLKRGVLDARFSYARWRPEPLTSAIRHVDLDDGAIDSVGRWPWDRSTLADAVNEMARAGVKVAAFDILFKDPQEPAVGPDGPVDHDAALAASLEHLPGVLAVDLGRSFDLPDVWHAEDAGDELDALLATLTADITIDASAAADTAGLTGERRARFIGRPLAYKEFAARRAVYAMSGEQVRPVPFDDFVAAIAPNLPPHVGDFPERGLLERVWRGHASWSRLVGLLAPADAHGDGANDDAQPVERPPIMALAGAASALGFVDYKRDEDEDGSVRYVSLLQPAPGGDILQFGLAAAALYLGLSPSDVRIEGQTLHVGDRSLPLHEGRMLINWPTTDTDWSGALRQSEASPPTEGHVSIGALVSLARERRKLDRLRADLAALTAEIGSAYFGDPDAPIVEVRDQVSFILDDVRSRGGVADLDEDERADLAPFLQWAALDESVRSGEIVIEEAEQRVRDELGGSLVFVGWTATGAAADFLPTPLASQTPGVVVHATVADMAITGRSLRVAPDWAGPALALVIGAACTMVATLPLAVSLILAVLVLVGYAGVAGVWMFGGPGWVAPVSVPVTAGVLSWVACTALEAALSQRDRQRITRQFRARVSPQLVDYLTDDPSALSVNGEQREASVLFLDIAGFTSLSEKLGGKGTVAALNQAMGALTRALTDEDAYVNKFLGDGVMAFWSAFGHDEDQATRACRAAAACQRALDEVNRSPEMEHLPDLAARVGITTGEVVIGDCGAPPDLNDYTVIGDNVNLSSRLESANKQFGTSVLIDDATKSQLRDGVVRTRPLGRIVVVGQTKPVTVHEGVPEGFPQAQIDATAAAVNAFCRGDMPAARAAWAAYRERYGDSKLVAMYAAAMDAVEAGESPADGSLRLRDK